MSMITLEVNDLQLSGTQAIRHSNYAAYLIRSKYQTENELKNSYGSENFNCNNIVISSFDDSNKPISIKSDVTINQAVRELDGKLFLDPIGFVTDLQVLFVKESREYSIFYDYKISENIIFKIKIQDGYKIESLPEELNISTPEQYANASISTKEMNGEIVITYIKGVNQTIIPPQYYAAVKEVLSLQSAKAKEKIVLSKI